jgi:DNA invertase Pin-like site-specific DNA recombinase
MRRAFSYSRFSTPEQAAGRSLQRQLKAARAYCQRHQLTLDERAFSDRGVSGYHGANATHGELAEFLELVEEGRIPKGSVLIVENVDRISRLPPDEATALVMKIVQAGVDVATVSPEQRYTQANIHQTGVWVPLQVALCLAAEESRKKGERVADAWADKRDTAAVKKLSKKGPAWLKLTADRKGWVVLEDKARMLRRMFELSLEGNGTARIAGVLNKEYPKGFTGRGWQPGQINVLLRSRSVLGEYQPHQGTCAKKGRKATRKPWGAPVPDYFPAVIAEADFYRVQAGLDARWIGGGRVSGTPNLFNGILYDAKDGCRMVMNASRGKRVLVSSGAVRHFPGSEFRAVRLDVFEPALLGSLRELTAADVLGKPTAAADRVVTLSAQLCTVNRNRDAAKAKAAAAEDVSVFFDLLADLDKQSKALAGELEKAKAQAAVREGDNLGEMQSLIDLLAGAEGARREALRAKLRAALRRVVREIRMLTVSHGRDRLLLVQVGLQGDHDGKRRSYVIFARPPLRGAVCREAAVFVHSVLEDPKDGTGLQGLNLADREEAAKAAATIAGWGEETWEEYARAAANPGVFAVAAPTAGERKRLEALGPFTPEELGHAGTPRRKK